MTEQKKGFFARNKKYFIAFLAIYVVLTVILILSSGGDLLPFVYQVF